MDPVVLALSFGTIFLVELPDKTFIATLVLATRYPPLLVWVGVGAAFLVQTAIAVALGTAAAALPTDLVRGAALVLFLTGAVLLFREARAHEELSGEEYAAKTRDVHGLKAVGASFVVLFAAEWGDLSQLLTLSLVARYDAPVTVFVGALCALLAVSGLAVLVGRALLERVPVTVLHYAGAGVCLLLAGLTAYELLA